MKTRVEWLQELPDGYRERAVANCVDERKNEMCDSITNALYGIYSLCKTPEEYGFWEAVYEHYRRGTTLPPLPSGNSEKPNNQSVNSPSHYNVHDKEVWEMMIDVFGKQAFVNFCALNAFKYRMRAGHKGDALEDIEKAKWYEGKMKELRG